MRNNCSLAEWLTYAFAKELVDLLPFAVGRRPQVVFDLLAQVVLGVGLCQHGDKGQRHHRYQQEPGDQFRRDTLHPTLGHGPGFAQLLSHLSNNSARDSSHCRLDFESGNGKGRMGFSDVHTMSN